jgi:choline dehydrogenase-like flavoprotein
LKNQYDVIVIGSGIGRASVARNLAKMGLQTDIKNLFVCDASILPHSLGTPLVLTLMHLDYDNLTILIMRFNRFQEESRSKNTR